jgi:hypothetical protein
MTKPIPEPTQLVTGMSHREMLTIMADNGIFCSHDKFCRILMDAQKRALAAAALERMVENAEELGLYEESQCSCQTCRPITMTDMRMVVCSTCGNKRCPKATDHRMDCTNSNEPGQPGSSYGTRLESAK